jgi:hypothetical protein
MSTPPAPTDHEARCAQLGDLAATLDVSPVPDERQWGAIQRALGPRPRRRRRLAIPLAVAMGVAGLAVIGSRLTLAYRIDGCATTPPGVLSVPADHAGHVRFAEGSRFELAPGTQAELQPEGFRRGARLRLHHGRTTATIIHRFAGEWHVLAGPFDVRVTGTAFTVEWDPASTHFHVGVTNGQVRVSGGPLNGATPVGAGQLLDILANLREITWTQATPAPPPPPAPPPAVLPSTEPAPVAASPPRHRKRRLAATRLTTPKASDTPVSLDPEARPAPGPGGPGFPLNLDPTADLSPPSANNPSGTLFVAIGQRARFLPPAERYPTHVFQRDDQRCTSVRIAALVCDGNTSASGSPCDWRTNWGALLGWFPRSDRKPWGVASAHQLSFDFQGTPGLYRLVAHDHRDPPSKVYCVDGYTPGKVVKPGDFRTECWNNRGPTLRDFVDVDFISLHRPSTNRSQSVQMCIKAVNLD